MATVIVGTGEYTYEVQKNWAKLPSGWSFGIPWGVAVDSQGRLYVSHSGRHPVVVFDADGAFLTSWGEDFLNEPYHIHVGPDDNVYVADRDSHQVFKCTRDGEVLLTFGEKDRPSLQAPFNHPTDVAVAPTGEIYVSDGFGNSRVHKFSPNGELLLSWGSPGSGLGQFWVPHALWVDGDGLVYVVDRENNRVQIFMSDGEYVSQWDDLFLPTDVTIDQHGVGYVPEWLTTRFSIFNKQGELLARGRIEDEPNALCVDSRGDFYVAQLLLRNVDKYVRRGQA